MLGLFCSHNLIDYFFHSAHALASTFHPLCDLDGQATRRVPAILHPDPSPFPPPEERE